MHVVSPFFSPYFETNFGAKILKFILKYPATIIIYGFFPCLVSFFYSIS